MNTKNEVELEEYGDKHIASYDAPVPKWLIFFYVGLPIWGIFAFYLYWNGSQGWLDRGYWQQLQRAANTTFPYINMDVPQAEILKEKKDITHEKELNDKKDTLN
jgi:hypothetical protein